ncbi:M24 family metallopeptidase [Gemmatimonadota bacterium]
MRVRPTFRKALGALALGLCFISLAGPPTVVAQAPSRAPAAVPPRIHPLPPLRDQAKIQQEWMNKRVTEVLPALMREYGVEMWILSMREYAEDPVFWSFKAPTTFAARRRSIYVFYDRGPEEGLERLALGGGSQGGLFEAYRSNRPSPRGDQAELVGGEQWRLLREVVEERDPQNIVLNINEDWAFADGLHAGEREALEAALGEDYLRRVKREPRLAVDYISVRIPEMMPRYRKMEETVHAIISQAFSNAVITPGETTTEDVVWWIREKIQELGMTTWFQPSVDVQRAGEISRDGPVVILPGDLLWTDMGIVAMGLHTDTQHLGYVLRPGETDVPEGLKICMANSNRMQDITLDEMEPGRSGNEALLAALEQMRSEGINGTLYSHPVGDHGHGSGPLIGRWDGQEGVPVRGEARIRPSTWFSIELQARTPIPEWDGKEASCRQEEEAYLNENGDRHWVFRRQVDFHLVW